MKALYMKVRPQLTPNFHHQLMHMDITCLQTKTSIPDKIHHTRQDGLATLELAEVNPSHHCNTLDGTKLRYNRVGDESMILWSMCETQRHHENSATTEISKISPAGYVTSLD